MLRVTSVRALDDYRLRVAFNDGVEHDVDCAFLLHGTLGEPLRDPEYFRQAHIDDEARTVVWPNGLDPAPELLHGDHDPEILKGIRTKTPTVSSDPDRLRNPPIRIIRNLIPYSPVF